MGEARNVDGKLEAGVFPTLVHHTLLSARVGGAYNAVRADGNISGPVFLHGLGAGDLPTGSGAQLVASVKKLYALEGDYTVCPGHGEDTTLEYERHNNGYVRC